MKNKDQKFLEEAYEQVKSAADKGNEVYFIGEREANQINLVPAIAYAMNAAAALNNPQFDAKGNMVFQKLQNFDEIAKQTRGLQEAMNACQAGLKNYFKGTPPKLNMASISDLNSYEAFGVGYYKNKKGLISYIGFQTPFWGSIYFVCEALHSDPQYFKGKYQYFTKDGYYDKVENKFITDKPAQTV
jgi:hypothetical protein